VSPDAPVKTNEKRHSVIVRFAGDSGDGMQLTGEQFTDASAMMGNDIATLPDFPAEIRAPIGTLPGVSSFQIQFSDSAIFTAGDIADVLVTMNPAGLKVNLGNVKKGGLIIVNENAFTDDNLKKAGFAANPLTDSTLAEFQIIKVPLSDLTRNALAELGLRPTETERCKNFFALGMMFWLYDRKMDFTLRWIEQKFGKKPVIAQANTLALKAGYNYADITETFYEKIEIPSAPIAPGIYRKVVGNQALALGLVAAAHASGKTLMYGTYPITPASDILHQLSKLKQYKIKTFQAEDEIAAIGFAIGASFAGELGITGTSGPGVCLKSEALGLAVMAELPLVLINVQRSGPSTGMPTKVEQSDLLQVMYGRNGESPVCVLAASTPSDCFMMAYEAVRIAFQHMVPVVILSDNNVANGSEPWKLPDIDSLPKIEIHHPVAGKDKFLPYSRDPKTLARPWAIPGTPGLEHRIGGLGKADLTGAVSYDGENNQKMINLRAEKVQRIADFIPELKVRGPKQGKLLILTWGSPYGAAYEAVSRMEGEGVTISQASLNYIHPFPKNMEAVLKGFETVLIPELNMGQLLTLVRRAYPGVNTVGFHKVQGQPFKVSEMVTKIKEVLK
jgi:2-oxoglutarate ferredoxin oxidoreductase subunit alpha